MLCIGPKASKHAALDSFIGQLTHNFVDKFGACLARSVVCAQFKLALHRPDLIVSAEP